MTFPEEQLAAFLVATSFAAGLNVYATVATMGLLSRGGFLALPAPLHLLSSWYVIGICGVLFVIEFFADKIPVFDLLWNALQTFVRIPVAALLAYGATAHLSSGMQVASALLAGSIALVAHGGKTAARAAVTPSPEPVSNIVLSLGEDTIAVLLTWFATSHPYWSAGAALLAVVLLIFMVRAIVRSLRRLFSEAHRQLKMEFSTTGP